jgi:hypothetical protein
LALITSQSKPIFEINTNVIHLYNVREKYNYNEIYFTWDEIEYVDINFSSLQRGYTVVLKVQTSLTKEKAKYKQHWFLTEVSELLNEKVMFTVDILDVDQDWEEIILNLESQHEKIVCDKSRINQIYENIDSKKREQSV